MRKEIKYLIGTRQIFWATVRAISFKGHGIVLSEVNLNNIIVEHMNIFPHSFHNKHDFKVFKQSIRIGDRVKLEARVSDYNKVEDGIEVTDFCLRDINLLNINPIIKSNKKKIGAKAVPCPSCGREKIIEIFEGEDIKEEDIICKCGKEYVLKYTVVKGKVTVVAKLKNNIKKRDYMIRQPFFNGIKPINMNY